MAFYYGDSIGQAANAEERALERALNLQLSNRSFLAQERARDEAIAAQNAYNRMRADELGLSMEQADRTNQMNLALGLENQRYTRGLTDYQTQLGLSEKEKDRALTRELNEVKQKQFEDRLTASESDALYRDIAKRIDTRAITNMGDMHGAGIFTEAITDPQYSNLVSRLGTKQLQTREEGLIGPGQAAQTANDVLQNNMLYKTSPGQALETVFRTLSDNRLYAGKIRPNYELNRFEPNPDYKFTGMGEDALNPEQQRLIEQRRLQYQPPAPATNTVPKRSFWDKMTYPSWNPWNVGQAAPTNMTSRLAVHEPAAIPGVETLPSTNAPVASEMQILDPRVRRYKELVAMGYSAPEAARMSNQK